MPKTYTITAENSKELRKAMKEKDNQKFLLRLQAVALRGEGKENDEIGVITGYHPAYVSHLVSIYCGEGLEGLCKDKRRGGNNRNMTNEAEKAFLARFEEIAGKGEMITINDISEAYNKQTGKNRESKSTIYYILHKHGWRVITPRTAHPGKASDEVCEASKKLTPS